MAKLKLFVHVVELDENGQASGRSAMFGPDDTVPDWAIANITNPDVWEIPPAKAKEAKAPGEPQGGKAPAKAAARKAAPAKAAKEPDAPPPDAPTA